jgi:hypothetical protein
LRTSARDGRSGGRAWLLGKPVLVGPFADDGPLRGIYIFDVPTVAEAEAVT